MAYNGWGSYDFRVWLWLKWVEQLQSNRNRTILRLKREIQFRIGSTFCGKKKWRLINLHIMTKLPLALSQVIFQLLRHATLLLYLIQSTDMKQNAAKSVNCSSKL